MAERLNNRRADSRRCTVETNNTVKQLYSNKTFFLNRKLGEEEAREAGSEDRGREEREAKTDQTVLPVRLQIPVLKYH